jgi:hypothetical protein
MPTSQESTPTASGALVTLRVAVTGHRDLHPSQEPGLRQSLHRTIDGLRRRCAPAQIELLTGMADGADQLATDVARELGCRIHIVLPKPSNEYRDELSDAGRRLFDEVSSDPGGRLSVIVEGGADLSGERDEAYPYRRLGAYFAESAHVLIALWDGRIERKMGGTLDVLAMYLDRSEGSDPELYLAHPVEDCERQQELSGPAAIWITTARVGDSIPDTTTTSYVVGSDLRGKWCRTSGPPVSLTQMLDDLRGIAEAASAAPATAAACWPLLDEFPDDLEPSRHDAMEEIHEAYLSADRLALRYQSRSDWSFIAASMIAAAMGFAFLWFAKIDDNLAWLYAYLALFAMGYVLYRRARSKHWLRFHLSLRVLAETLRVRFFTTLLGISDHVDVRRVLTLTGVSSFPGFSWTAEVDRMGVPTTQNLPVDIQSRNELVRRSWVDDQANYFERKIKQLHSRHERLEMIQGVLYLLSFVAVVVIIIYGVDLKKIYAPGHVSAKTIVIFLMGLLPLWLTLWELHQGRMATRELLWQFRNQATIFGSASARLENLDSEEASLKVYVELAERSLFETYLWTIHRFHREFTPPAGG